VPTAYRITFEPDRPVAPSTEQVRGLVASLVEPARDPDHCRQVQTFSVWPVRQVAAEGNRLELRLNWLADDDVAESRLAASLAAPQRLGGRALRAIEVAAEVFTYRSMRSLPALWECDFEFVSPTFFSRSGRDYLLPDPDLIVRSLLARWNFHNPLGSALAVEEDAVRGLSGRMVVKRHDIRSVRTQAHAGRGRTGFVGQVRLGLRNADRADLGGQDAARLFASACAYASFCGVGAQTTHCCGAVVTRPVHG
jgi:CRISPR-associated endoribonuclease Cas6